MISYRLKNGKEGNLTDPAILRVFYARLYFYDENKHEKNSRQRSSAPTPPSQAWRMEAR
jgi:hypothetical protein